MTFILHIFTFCFSSYPNTLKEILSFPHSFFFSLLFFSLLFLSLPFPSTEPNSLRASLVAFLNFYTVWRVNSCIYLLPIYIFKYTFQQTLYHFSISFKYYFFILFLIFIYSFFNISLCIPNYYIFLIPNNYIFKSPNGNI